MQPMQTSALYFLMTFWPFDESELIPVWTGVSFRKQCWIKMHSYKESTTTVAYLSNS